LKKSCLHHLQKLFLGEYPFLNEQPSKGFLLDDLGHEKFFKGDNLFRVKGDYPRGHFCKDMPSVYAFSAPLNWLDYDPTYPKNPRTLAEHIRKYRKDRGLLIRELAEELGIAEFTLINWEVRGRNPRSKAHIKTLKKLIPEAERFFAIGK
jgi:DNA-binding transcriptional regulator YiaG